MVFSLDVFTLKKEFNSSSAISGVSVFVDNKKVGVTNKFGFFTHKYQGNKDDLLTINLKTNQFLPENFDVDFIVSNNMSLVKYYTDKSPTKIKLIQGDLSFIGTPNENIDLQTTTTLIQDTIKKSLESSHLFSLQEQNKQMFNDSDSETYNNKKHPLNTHRSLETNLIFEKDNIHLELLIRKPNQKIAAAAISKVNNIDILQGIEKKELKKF